MKKNKAGTIVYLALAAAMVVMAGCGGAGGGWSSGDVTPVNAGSVNGYAYQSAGAANRMAAARQVLVPLEGATVTIGGMSGTTNSLGYYSIDNVPAGTYNLVITADGFTGVTVQSVSVTGGQAVTATQQDDATYALSPSSAASFQLDSSPQGAAIYLNAADTESTTPNTFDLNAGSYSIQLVKTGYENYETTATISSSGGSATYSLSLKVSSITALPASLTVAPGGSATPSVTCTYSDSSTGACPSLTWSSADTDVATVNASTGAATGVSGGTVTITGTRDESNAGVSIPVTVISAGDTISSVTIDAEGVSNNALALSSGGSAAFTSICVYSLAGTSACDSSCVYSSSDTSAGTITSAGAFTCAASGGTTDVMLTCGSTESNTVEVSCAVQDTSLELKLFAAPDADADGEADSAFADSITPAPGDDIIVRVKVENAEDITGFRTDLEINGSYLSPKTQTDAANCSAYNDLAYDSSSVCVTNFGTVLSPSNPFFGSSDLDTIGAVTYVSGSTVEPLTCVDTGKKANRLDCAVSTRQSGDVQPAVDGSGYFVYFLLESSSSAVSGTQTPVSISSDTLQIVKEDGVAAEIGAGQVSGLTITFQ